VATPVISSRDIVSYIFGFNYAGDAGLDPVVGSLSQQQEMLLYFLNISSATPIRGYQTAIVQYGPVNSVLLNHPSLLLAYNLSAAYRGEASLIRTVFSDDQIRNLLLIATPFGPVATPLLPAATAPTPPPPLNVYTMEDGITPYTTEDGITAYTPE
jgi:hypothetical protein